MTVFAVQYTYDDRTERRDEVRGEHYELFCAGPVDELGPRLPAVLGDLPLPRAVHRVPIIPRTATGKVKADRLYALSVRSAAGVV